MSKSLVLPPRHQALRSELTDLQMIFLDSYILGIGNTKLLFQLLLGIGKSETVSNSLMKALIESSYGKEYIKRRSEQLKDYFFEEDKGSGEDLSLGDSQKRIVERVMADLAKGVEDGSINYRSNQIIEAFVKKALDDKASDVLAPEPPRIYLPENCLNCRYRIACESDDVVDDCKWCKYRKSCNERGEVYDQKTQLEIPDEELKK